jgi:glutamyl-Q tRNA(Asp) synthetase
LSYRGRFAPSPTGPLHFGSLVAALASWLDARAHDGEWLVRMEDLDRPRCVLGADAVILRQLEAYGLRPDGPVLYQSTRDEAYEAAFAQLPAYPCGCRRTTYYPGTCRNGLPPGVEARAWRVRVDEETIRFEDRWAGPQEESLAASCGDFVVKRADGMFAYQLAVVVDDAAQGITHVVRGADLLDSTARQIHLQRLLDVRAPRYLHVPVVTNEQGEKLSKQTLAPALPLEETEMHLRAALRFLGLRAQSVAGAIPEWRSRFGLPG